MVVWFFFVLVVVREICFRKLRFLENSMQVTRNNLLFVFLISNKINYNINFSFCPKIANFLSLNKYLLKRCKKKLNSQKVHSSVYTCLCIIFYFDFNKKNYILNICRTKNKYLQFIFFVIYEVKYLIFI